MVGDNRCGVSLEQSLPGRRNKRLMNTTIPVVVINFGKCECAVAMWARLKRKLFTHYFFLWLLLWPLCPFHVSDWPPKNTITHVPLFDSWSPGTWHENKCQGTLGPFQLALVCQQGKSKGQKTTFWNRAIINRVLYCLSSNEWQHNTQKVAKTKKSADSCKCCILSGYQDVDSWKISERLLIVSNRMNPHLWLLYCS